MEKDVKASVKKYLKEIGAWYIMPVPMIYGKKSIDFLVCYKGKFYAIEAKSDIVEKPPTKLQRLTMNEIESAGGKCCVELDCNLPNVKRMLCGTMKNEN